MLAQMLEKLHELISGGNFEEDARRAMALFRERTGAAFDDDPSHENRMALFTEWFILDYPKESGSMSPIEFCAAGVMGISPEERRALDALRKNVHDIFEVRRAGQTELALMAIYMDREFAVQSPDKAGMFRKGDLFEGRIVHLDGKWHLLNGFCNHQSKAGKFIKKELAAIRSRNGAGFKAFVAKLAAMSLMSERSRNIPVDEIYKNEAA